MGQISLEDLILSSRSLALEEKQELLKRLDGKEPDKQKKLQEILEREFESFQKLDEAGLNLVQNFLHVIKPLTAGAAA